MADSDPTTEREGRPLVAIAGLPAALAPDIERAGELAREEKSAATRRAYGSDFAIFRAWYTGRGANPLPALPTTVAAFLAHEAGRGTRPSTMGRRVAAIRYAHKLGGHAVPTDDERVKATVRGIRRTLGIAARKKRGRRHSRVAPTDFGAGSMPPAPFVNYVAGNITRGFL